jgi:hypothetical protein
MDDSSSASCAWAGTVDAFLNTPAITLQAFLRAHLATRFGDTPQPSQERAWQRSITILHRSFSELLSSQPDLKNAAIILEYELPRERGRRPDFVILAGSVVMVIEFKDSSYANPAFIDQVTSYVRDVQHYHEQSRKLNVSGCLVLSSEVTSNNPVGTSVVGPRALSQLLHDSLAGCGAPSVPLETWLTSDFAPLPSLICAARTIFNHEPLPSIRTASSAGIQATLVALESICTTARERGEHHLALVTGVPGSGKTLVGLQFVYTIHATPAGEEYDAVFLTGNGPLCSVLQYVLKSPIFVRDIHGFLRTYGGSQPRKYGINDEYFQTSVKNFPAGPWYAADPSDRKSCCQFDRVATEFVCQGLEVDLPIIAWGADLQWHGDRWVCTTQPSRSPRRASRTPKNPEQLRLNSYRVLLTRGRDGLVVFIPPEPSYASTEQTLQAAGMIPLDGTIS